MYLLFPSLTFKNPTSLPLCFDVPMTQAPTYKLQRAIFSFLIIVHQLLM